MRFTRPWAAVWARAAADPDSEPAGLAMAARGLVLVGGCPGKGDGVGRGGAGGCSGGNGLGISGPLNFT